jgi:porin
MALYFTQNFGNLVSLRVGKINMIELARYTPLKGGGGVDTFWNAEFAAPISGLVPPTLNGAMLSINTQPVSFGLTVFDPQDATNKPLFSNLFANGVNVMGSATLKTEIAGRSGYYGIKGIYSTREGRDLSEIIPPPGTPPSTKQGSWYVGLSVQQYLLYLRPITRPAIQRGQPPGS